MDPAARAAVQPAAVVPKVVEVPRVAVDKQVACRVAEVSLVVYPAAQVDRPAAAQRVAAQLAVVEVVVVVAVVR